MSEHDDIIADLFDEIEAIPTAPDLEIQSLYDIAAFGAALQLAAALLTEASNRWATNARIALPEWEGHHPQTNQRKRK
jgi:hypothetical protein